jgi:RimJ/RimL family protein N-acetyltransferase
MNSAGDGSGRLVALREVVDEDLPVFYTHQRDSTSNWMADVPHREAAEFYAHWAKIRAEPSCVLRTIVADGVVAGNAVSFLRDGMREIGYWLGQEHWGRGIASAAVGLLLADLPERPLYGVVSSDNAGSVRVLARHGFRLVGSESEYSRVREQTNELLRFVLD